MAKIKACAGLKNAAKATNNQAKSFKEPAELVCARLAIDRPSHKLAIQLLMSWEIAAQTVLQFSYLNGPVAMEEHPNWITKSPPFGELLNQLSASTYTSVTITEIYHIASRRSSL